MKPGDLVKAADKLRVDPNFTINLGDVGLVTGVIKPTYPGGRITISVLINGRCIELHQSMLERLEAHNEPA